MNETTEQKSYEDPEKSNPEFEKNNSAEKWDNFYSSGQAPWDSGRVYSQLETHFKTLVPARKEKLRVLELGCGIGHNLDFLQTQLGQNLCALGVDISKVCYEMSRKAYPSFGFTEFFPEILLPGVSLLVGDLFKLPNPIYPSAKFDVIIDFQCFHVFQTKEYVSIIKSNLKSGGMYFLMTGNDHEPYMGPHIMNKEQLSSFFPSSEFTPIIWEESRFDYTPEYQKLGKQPLAWMIIFQKK